MGNRAHSIVLREMPGIGDVRLLSIPATLKLCRRIIAELQSVAAVRSGRFDGFPPIVQVCPGIASCDALPDHARTLHPHCEIVKYSNSQAIPRI